MVRLHDACDVPNRGMGLACGNPVGNEHTHPILPDYMVRCPIQFNMKPFKDMDAREYWEHIHSDKNINGLAALTQRDTEEALPHARHLALCGNSFARWGQDILTGLETIKGHCIYANSLPTQFQVVEWQLSKVVQEAAAILLAAGKLQEYLHGAREASKTLEKLQKEKEIGYDNL